MSSSATIFHADKVHAAIQSDDAARYALVASWRRSATLHHLDPAERKPPRRLTEGELTIARQRIEPLIHAARSSLDRLHRAVGGVGCCVLLADRKGVPVERRGASADDRTFSQWGLWPGSVWSEESEGTNGIGTCLVEGRALTIHRDQHFFSRNSLLSCTTAPVYDHEGELAAALDVSSCRADLTADFADLIAMAVRDAARQIELENFRRVYAGARIVLAPGADAPYALIALDGDDLVVGATQAARSVLGIGPGALDRAVPAADLPGLGAGPAEDLRDAERLVIERALLRADGNVSAAARNLNVSRATLYRKLRRFGPKATRMRSLHAGVSQN